MQNCNQPLMQPIPIYLNIAIIDLGLSQMIPFFIYLHFSFFSRDATEYALLRLVRGLASSREFARQGFSTCLCAVLNANDSTLAAEALKILDDNTAVSIEINVTIL